MGVPIMYIVVSQTAEWQADQSHCDQELPDYVCICLPQVPSLMFAMGCLHLFHVFTLLCVGGMLVVARSEARRVGGRDRTAAWNTLLHCIQVVSGVSITAISIAMWISLVSSRKKCSPVVWDVGVFSFFFFVFFGNFSLHHRQQQ
mmetsp:Transcript_84570/g.137086  ORF Transcript_84570/g.137086 Transcript_84570/m.137086 type:complete len:145 (-) Transcript_84570:389-823(-)